MKASELIEKLEELIREHGDKEVKHEAEFAFWKIENCEHITGDDIFCIVEN